MALGTYSLAKAEFVYSRYNLLQVQYLWRAEYVSILTGLAIIVTQIILCVCIWMVIIGRKVLPMFLVLIAVGFVIPVLLVTLLSLKAQSNYRIFNENLIIRNINGFRVYGIKVGGNGYLKRMWKCQLPLRIYYGKQFAIGRDAVTNYLDVLSSNATNLVVLLKI